MKYLTEFRNSEHAKRIADQIHRIATRPWAIMEVCGGQTHSIIRNGIDQIRPSNIELIHGPGCPVCVTPLSVIDQALAIAMKPNVIFCSFGDICEFLVRMRFCCRSKVQGVMFASFTHRSTP